MHPETNRIAKDLSIEPTSCACSSCEQMCHKQVCIGTPQEMLTIANNGFGDHLMHTTWAVGLFIGLPIIEMTQIEFDKSAGKCSMLDDNNRCRLHVLGIKPTEGVLSDTHGTLSPRKGVAMIRAIYDAWDSPSNAKALRALDYLLQKQEQK